jgi:acetyl-CoA C-acetyltransferase
MAYSTQRKDVAIVGIYEYPKRVVGPGVTPNHIRIESARKALDDAGLKWQDVDGFYDAQGGGLGGSEYFGLKPNTIDTTSVGGSSFEFHAAHAVQAIREGKCRVALLTYGSTAHTDGRAIGTGGFGGFAGPATMQQNMTAPWGGATAANYALVKTRHMHQYGTKPEQFAEISVATRAHAMRNPEAVQAMKDLAYENIREITIEDVLESRMIADPLHLLECCMVSDGGGAVVIASAEVARNTRKKPVWIIGTGQATKYRENNGDITVSAGAQSAPQAFGEAGIKPEEIDNAQMYGSFTITQLVCMEDLGFCKKGEGGDFVSGGRLRWDTPQKPAMGTDGSGYSSNHPGMHGIFLLLEGTRQLRGESTSQVPDAKLGVAHGNGGDLGGTHSGSTIILARD